VTAAENLIELPPLVPSNTASLSGGRAPVRTEADEDGPFTIAGVVPPVLNGQLLLLGPNPMWVDDVDSHHSDDGDGMVHAISLSEGRPTSTRSRFVRTRTLARRWGAQAPPGPLNLAGPLANRSVVLVAGRLLALDGRGFGYRLAAGLDTALVEDFETMLSTTMGSCVVVDPPTGRSTFLGSGFRGPDGLVLTELGADGIIGRTTPLPLPYQPDDPPIEVLDDLVAIGLGSHALTWRSEEHTGDPNLVFDLERPSAIGLLPRGGTSGDVRWCSTVPGVFTAFISLIASGTGADGVVLRRDPSPGDDGAWRPERTGGWLASFQADTRMQSLRLEALDDLELLGVAIDPVAAPDLRRYAYGVTADHSVIIKYNFRSGSTTRTELPEHLLAGHPLFWRDPEGRSDEEGWLLVPCLDRTTHCTALMIFDATRTAAEPEAIIGMPTRIPLDAKGLFLPRAQGR